MNRKMIAKACATAAAALLLVSGCGGQADEESVAPTPTHTAEPGEPALPQVAGYEYHDMEGSDLAKIDAARADMDAVNEEYPGTFIGAAFHDVTGPDGAEFLVVEYQVGPAAADDLEQMDVWVTYMAGVFAKTGAAIRVGTMGGVEVAQGVSDDYAACSWTQGDLMFVVAGEDEDSVNDYTEALIQACDEM